MNIFTDLCCFVIGTVVWWHSSLVQIMACRLFGAKPLSKPMRHSSTLPHPIWYRVSRCAGEVTHKDMDKIHATKTQQSTRKHGFYPKILVCTVLIPPYVVMLNSHGKPRQMISCWTPRRTWKISLIYMQNYIMYASVVAQQTRGYIIPIHNNETVCQNIWMYQIFTESTHGAGQVINVLVAASII